MQQYPTNPKYQARQHEDLAAFLKGLTVRFPPVSDCQSHEEVMAGAKRRVAERLADRFAADNPQFDREKFLKACGVGD